MTTPFLLLLVLLRATSSFTPTGGRPIRTFVVSTPIHHRELQQQPFLSSTTTALSFKKDMRFASRMEKETSSMEEMMTASSNKYGRAMKKSLDLLKRIWNRMDTLKSAGVDLTSRASSVAAPIDSSTGTTTTTPLSPTDMAIPPDVVGTSTPTDVIAPKPSINVDKFKTGNRGILTTLLWGGIVAGILFMRWYRAKYVFHTDFFDIQPSWNMVTTTEKQENELRAYTCKNCGATIFIARNREWFFEGATGLGSGCFACGATGRDNFVMDRDRIKDEVKDLDDYYEYDRPLDFVQKAEYKKLMKETGGDEEAANRLLIERQAAKEEAEVKHKKPELFAEKWVKDAEIVEDGGDDEEEYYDEDEEEYEDDEEYEEYDEEEEWDDEEYEETESTTEIEASADTTEVTDDTTVETTNLDMKTPPISMGPAESAGGEEPPPSAEEPSAPPTPPEGLDSMDVLGLDDF